MRPSDCALLFPTHNKAARCVSLLKSTGFKRCRRFTFNTADSPQSGVREISLLSFEWRLGLVRRGVGAVTNVRARVEPVVRADGDGHQAEGGESPHCGQQRLNPTVTPSHCASYYKSTRVRTRTQLERVSARSLCSYLSTLSASIEASRSRERAADVQFAVTCVPTPREAPSEARTTDRHQNSSSLIRLSLSSFVFISKHLFWVSLFQQTAT